MSYISNNYLRSDYDSFVNIIRVISSKIFNEDLNKIVESVINNKDYEKMFNQDYKGIVRNVHKIAQNSISITEITHALLKIQNNKSVTSII